MAIDFGSKRTGLAVTDPSQIIASPLDTIATNELLKFLKGYHSTEGMELFVVGMPKNLSNQDTHSTAAVRTFIEKLRIAFPNTPVEEIDERFTSKMAFDAMIAGGLRKKARRNKATVDKLSATIILQSYLESRQ